MVQAYNHIPTKRLIPLRTLINNSLPAWLFIFCVIVFASGLGGDFVMDDWPVIKENSKITDTKYIPDYFTSGVWANTDLAEEVGIGGHSLYRPVFLLTLNLSYQLWGDSALGYHALNLTLHSINTILVYFLILGFLSPNYRMVAGMSAAIFAVHPVHVESIAWITGMTDPLVSLFLLCGFLLHRRGYQSTSRQKKWVYAISAPLCFALALLSKETAIFFPLILIIYDVLFQRNALRLKPSSHVISPMLHSYWFILYCAAMHWMRVTFNNPAHGPASISRIFRYCWHFLPIISSYSYSPHHWNIIILHPPLAYLCLLLAAFSLLAHCFTYPAPFASNKACMYWPLHGSSSPCYPPCPLPCLTNRYLPSVYCIYPRLVLPPCSSPGPYDKHNNVAALPEPLQKPLLSIFDFLFNRLHDRNSRLGK